jgi:hypothetical protein
MRGRVPFEAPEERSRVCFGGFRPTKLVEEPRALARGAPLLYISITLSVDSRKGLKIKEVESLESKDVGSRDQGDIGLDGPEGFC